MGRLDARDDNGFGHRVYATEGARGPLSPRVMSAGLAGTRGDCTLTGCPGGRKEVAHAQWDHNSVLARVTAR